MRRPGLVQRRQLAPNPMIRVAVLCAGAALAAGCGLLVDLDALERCADDGCEDASTSDVEVPGSGDGPNPTQIRDGAADGQPDGPGADCPEQGGPMELAEGFCIDRTEVTNASYRVFVEATQNGSDTAGQPSVCAWNTDYKPGLTQTWYPNVTGNFPVVGVDWCDARAYCAWAGKRLCGQYGGGPLASVAAAGTALSEWYRTCTSSDTRRFATGTTYEPGLCHDTQPINAGVAEVGSYPRCVTDAGALDMQGNAGEWVDACDKDDAGNLALCVASSSYNFDSSALACAISISHAPAEIGVAFGVRCCADRRERQD